jgi:predicted ATP-grasp superfamily ATP-dependent carboligase
MKDELIKYAVKFSDYAGGVSISTYIADKAEPKGIEYLSFFASVPAYDFSQLSTPVQGVGVENDFKAWYDLMKRLNHMFGLKVDLAELALQSSELASAMEARLKELEDKVPDLREYMARLSASFEEMPFIPLDDVWERELGDLL